MYNEAPVSIMSSSASAPPATSNPEGSAATPPSRRNLDVLFEVADSSCSEYVVSDSEESEHHDAIDVATDADNKEDLPDIYADPNIVLVSENPDDYTRLDSDDDNDGASVYSEDDDLGPAEAAAEDGSIAPDLHFDSYTVRKRVPSGNSDATRKRRQRACKVCSVLKGTNEPRGGETTYCCAECKLETASKSVDAAQVFLCNKIKHTTQGEVATCFDIWHKHW
ncbi:hypothetical protein PC117_g21416 [Phytophthora cactorum]|uniref:PiggyBac transposable element-derived protein 4 C-terminal zinc-ribbon domain-containing protein n=1 Tax=Phytophthora cactorum TaxID=29920 RepID=A0A8T1BL91_9STRA|nr:hypothetical protein PC117_g21416 [Phytophthora cactorum]